MVVSTVGYGVPETQYSTLLCDGLALYADLQRESPADVWIAGIYIKQFHCMGGPFVIRQPTRGQVILMEMLAATVDVR